MAPAAVLMQMCEGQQQLICRFFVAAWQQMTLADMLMPQAFL